MLAELTADTRLLVTAEWRYRVNVVVAVDPHRSGFKCTCNLVRSANIVGPHCGGQPVGRVIALEYGVVFIFERDHGSYRTENLLACDSHVILYSRKDGRIYKVTLARPYFPAELGVSAFLLADVEVALDPFKLFLGDQWPNGGFRVERIAGFGVRRVLGQGIHKFIVKIPLYEDASSGAADLARQHSKPEQRGWNCLLKVRVGENDIRRFAAELQRDPFQIARRGLQNQLSYFGRSCEGNFVDVRMTRDCGSRGLPEAGDYIDHALRDSSLENQLPKT